MKSQLKYLTEEEASHYFTAEEAELSLTSTSSDWGKLLGFTSIPDDEDPEWEFIKYYSKRKRRIYFEGEGNYYLYILSNPAMPGIYKIGYTGKHPEVRAKEISRATGVPLEYKVAKAFRCNDGHGFEKRVHKMLDYCRVNTEREHFQLPLEEAIKIIEELKVN